MDASDDEGARCSGDEDAASVDSVSSEKASAFVKESESGDETPASPPDHDAQSDHSDNDDEVHISEAEVSNDGSESEGEQKEEDGSEVGDEDDEREKVGSDSDDDAHNNDRMSSKCSEKEESDVGSVSGDEKDELADGVSYAERKGSDAGSVSGDEGKENLTTQEQNDDNNEPSSPQREDGEDSFHEINIDSGDEDHEPKLSIDSGAEDSERKSNIDSGEEDNEVRSVSRASEDEKDSDVEANTNVASDDEDSSPTKGNNDEEASNKGEEEDDDDGTPSKEKEEKDQDESDDEKIRSGGKKREYGDLISNIFGSSDEEGEKDGESGVPTKKKKMRKRARVSIESDEENEGEEKEKENANESDEEMQEENDDGPEDKGNESDVEEKGEVEPENEDNEEVKDAPQVDSDDDSADEALRKSKGGDIFVSDFDLMLQKKKEESSRRRKRKDVDIINDSDDLIAEIISKMRQAADEDKMLNKEKRTATKKLKILPLVMSQLKKQDMKMAFLDQGVLNVIADWLAPLPDKSLPHLHIREGMIKMLLEFPSIDHSLLKSSGVGRVLMYLYKHPKETKENKEKAGKLITEWARPIFNVTTDYHSLTKEEREQRDIEHLPRKKRGREEAEDRDSPEKKDIEKALNESDVKLRPGDKGWVGRARVPLPSTKDYVVRPKWNVEMELGRSVSKKSMNRFEKHMRTMQEKKRMSKGQRAVTISIEGRKMAI